MHITQGLFEGSKDASGDITGDKDAKKSSNGFQKQEKQGNACFVSFEGMEKDLLLHQKS